MTFNSHQMVHNLRTETQMNRLLDLLEAQAADSRRGQIVSWWFAAISAAIALGSLAVAAIALVH